MAFISPLTKHIQMPVNQQVIKKTHTPVKINAAYSLTRFRHNLTIQSLIVTKILSRLQVVKSL